MKLEISTGLSIFLLASLLFCSFSSFAQDYYIHPTVGSNTNSGLAPDDAFATIEFAARHLSPGDNLYFRSGIYTDSLYLNSDRFSNGSSTQPITLKAFPNEQPVFSNGVTLSFMDLKWWVVDGLIFQNATRMGLGQRDGNLPSSVNQCVGTVEHITIKDVRFQHSSDQPGITITCGRHIRIENNIFDNLRSRIAGRDTHGIQFGYYADDVVISGNHFSDIGADGIQFQDNLEGAQFTNIAIDNNEFEIIRPYQYRDVNGDAISPELQPFDNVGENAIDIKQGPGPIVISNNSVHGFRPTTEGQDASGDYGTGITIHNSAQNITLSKNSFYDNVTHLNVVGNTIEERPERDVLIDNNIFEETVDPADYPGYNSVALAVGNVSNVRVLNNTIHNSSSNNRILFLTDNTENMELKNNVFYNGQIKAADNIYQNGAIVIQGHINLSADYNAWGNIDEEVYPMPGMSALLGSNDVVSDYLQVDWTTHTPLETSPLVDAGTNTGITEDFYGATISGAYRDIGAVENQHTSEPIGASPDTEPPTISISEPIGGTVSGTVQINVDATDNTGVSSVRLIIDGHTVGSDISAPYSFTWDTTAYIDGETKLVARAYDAAGNQNQYVVYVTVSNLITIQDTTPPIISAPPNKSQEATGQFTSVNLGTASAMDDVDGSVAVTPNSTGPFSVGAHLVTWSATDTAGNTATATQTITIIDTTHPTVCTCRRHGGVDRRHDRSTTG